MSGLEFFRRKKGRYLTLAISAVVIASFVVTMIPQGAFSFTLSGSISQPLFTQIPTVPISGSSDVYGGTSATASVYGAGGGQGAGGTSSASGALPVYWQGTLIGSGVPAYPAQLQLLPIGDYSPDMSAASAAYSTYMPQVDFADPEILAEAGAGVDQYSLSAATGQYADKIMQVPGTDIYRFKASSTDDSALIAALTSSGLVSGIETDGRFGPDRVAQATSGAITALRNQLSVITTKPDPVWDQENTGALKEGSEYSKLAAAPAESTSTGSPAASSTTSAQSSTAASGTSATSSAAIITTSASSSQYSPGSATATATAQPAAAASTTSTVVSMSTPPPALTTAATPSSTTASTSASSTTAAAGTTSTAGTTTQTQSPVPVPEPVMTTTALNSQIAANTGVAPLAAPTPVAEPMSISGSFDTPQQGTTAVGTALSQAPAPDSVPIKAAGGGAATTEYEATAGDVSMRFATNPAPDGKLADVSQLDKGFSVSFGSGTAVAAPVTAALGAKGVSYSTAGTSLLFEPTPTGLSAFVSFNSGSQVNLKVPLFGLYAKQDAGGDIELIDSDSGRLLFTVVPGDLSGSGNVCDQLSLALSAVIPGYAGLSLSAPQAVQGSAVPLIGRFDIVFDSQNGESGSADNSFLSTAGAVQGSVPSGYLAALKLGDGELDLAPASGSAISEQDDSNYKAFSGAAGGADLRIKPMGPGAEEEIVLSAPPASSTFNLPLRLSPSMSLKQVGSKIFIVDPKGNEVAAISAAEMFDSRAASEGGPAGSNHVSLALSAGADGSQSLTISGDLTWLSDPSRVYPVFIDPTITCQFPGNGTLEPTSTPEFFFSYSNNLVDYYTWTATNTYIEIAQDPGHWNDPTIQDYIIFDHPIYYSGNLGLVSRLALPSINSLPEGTYYWRTVVQYTYGSYNQWIPSDPATEFYVNTSHVYSISGVLPASLPTGTFLTVPITVKNRGMTTWNATGSDFYALGYHISWTDPGNVVHNDMYTTPLTTLPYDLPPGQQVTLNAQINVPAAKDGSTMTINWDMVQNGVCWFADRGEHPFTTTTTAQSAWNATYSTGGASLPTSANTEGTEGTLTLTIIPTDAGTALWNPQGAPSAALGGHWVNSSGQDVKDYTGSPAASGVAQRLPIPTPAIPGAYTFQVDMYNSSNQWLSSLGVPTLNVPVMINAYGVIPQVSYAKISDTSQLNLTSGNLVMSTTDYTSNGRGPPIDITRTLNTLAAFNGASGSFGRGWSSILDSNLQVLKNSDGSISSATYFAPDGGAETYYPSGRVTSIVISNGGTGYTSAPSVTISGGGGSGAAATAVVSGGIVTPINIIDGGYGYTSVPTVTIAPPSSGTQGTATATLTTEFLHPRGYFWNLTQNQDGSYIPSTTETWQFKLVNQDQTLIYYFGATNTATHISQLEAEVDNNGNATVFNYNTSGQIVSIDEASKDPARQVDIGYVTSGNGTVNVAYVKVPSADTSRGYSYWTYSYDASGWLSTVTYDPSQNPSGSGDNTAPANPLNITTTYNYLGSGPLTGISITTMYGAGNTSVSTTTLYLDKSGRLTHIDDPRYNDGTGTAISYTNTPGSEGTGVTGAAGATETYFLGSGYQTQSSTTTEPQSLFNENFASGNLSNWNPVATNVAFGKTTSSSGNYDAAHSSGKIVDGSFDEASADFWLTPDNPSTTNPSWVQVDLGAQYEVFGMNLLPTHAGAMLDRATTAWHVSVSNDGATWTDVARGGSPAGMINVNGADGQIPWQQVRMSPSLVHYVRFYVDGYFGYGGGLDELQVYGVPTGATPDSAWSINNVVDPNGNLSQAIGVSPNNPNGYGDEMLVSKDSYSDFSFESSIYMNQNNDTQSDVGLVFRETNSKTDTGIGDGGVGDTSPAGDLGYYYFRACSNPADSVGGQAGAALWKRENGTWHRLAAVSFSSISKLTVPVQGHWYTLKVIAKGPYISCFVNGTQMFVVADFSFTRGRVGLRAESDKGTQPYYYFGCPTADPIQVYGYQYQTYTYNNEGEIVGQNQALSTTANAYDDPSVYGYSAELPDNRFSVRSNDPINPLNNEIYADDCDGPSTIWAGLPSWTNYSVEADVEVLYAGAPDQFWTLGGNAGLIVRSNGGAENGYYAGLFPNPPAGNGSLFIKKLSSPTTGGTLAGTSATGYGTPLGIGQWRHIKIVVNTDTNNSQATRIQVYYGGNLLDPVTKIIDTDANFAHGQIGLRVNEARALFKNVIVTGPDGSVMALDDFQARGDLTSTDSVDKVTGQPSGDTILYDQNNRSYSTIDQNKQRTTLTRDANGNVITESDPSGNVTTMTYDAYGNVISKTVSQQPTYNDVPNPGFENQTDWQFQYANPNHSTTTGLAYDNSKAYEGSWSLHIVSSGNSTDDWVGANSSLVPVKPGDIYTVSAEVASSGLKLGSEKDGTQYHHVFIQFFDSSRTPISKAGALIPAGKYDWQRISETVSAPAGAAYAYVFICVLGGGGTSSSIWIDDVQMEEGATSPEGNLIQDPNALTGTTATATANRASGTVSSFSITGGGSGYTYAPTVVITGGGGSGAAGTAVISSGITQINLTSGGGGYSSAPSVNISGGGGSGALATANISAGGAVTSVTVTNPGSGYVAAPTITFTGGVGSGAAATALISGTVTGITVTSGGSGYTSAPQVSISAPNPWAGNLPWKNFPAGSSGATVMPPTDHDTNWLYPGSGNWGVDSQGYMSAFFWQGAASDSTLISANVPNGLKSFSASITMIQGRDVGLVFDYDQSTGNMYEIRCSGDLDDKDNSGDPTETSYKTALWKRVSGVWTNLTKGQGSTYDMPVLPALGSTYTVKVSITGNTITWSYSLAYKNYTSKNYTWTDNNSPLSSGHIGFRVGGEHGYSQEYDHFASVSATDSNGTFLKDSFSDLNTYLSQTQTSPNVTSSWYQTLNQGSVIPGQNYTLSANVMTVGGNSAVASASVLNGQVQSISVINGGSGYASPPLVILIGGGGSGAIATAAVANGAVSSVTITNAGSGYTSAPTVLFESNSGARLHITWLDANGNTIAGKDEYSPIYLTDILQREALTVTPPVGATSATIYLEQVNYAGETRFSDISFELASGTGSYSLLGNGSFETTYTTTAATDVTGQATTRPCGWLWDDTTAVVNLQPNGGYNWAADTTTYKFGAGSLRVSTATPKDTTAHQIITVKPNTSYVLSGWIKTNAVAAGKGEGALMRVISGGDSYITPAVTGDTDWNLETVFFTTGPNTTSIDVGLQLGYGGPSSGTAWFDGVQLAEATKWSSQNIYDPDGNYVTESKDPAGAVSDLQLDKVGNKLAEVSYLRTNNVYGTNPGAQLAPIETDYSYDSASRLLLTTYPADINGNRATASTTYDNSSNKLTTTDANGVTTSYTYDAAGDNTEEQTPSQPIFTDNFPNGLSTPTTDSLWTPKDPSQWSIPAGGGYYLGTASGSWVNETNFTVDPSLSNYIYQAKLSVVNGWGGGLLIQASGDPGNNFIELAIAPSSTPTSGKWYLFGIDSVGNFTQLNTNSYTLAYGVFYWLKLVVSGQMASGYISSDGSTWANLFTGFSLNQPQGVFHDHGKVGLIVWSDGGGAGNIQFENVSVSSYSTTVIDSYDKSRNLSSTLTNAEDLSTTTTYTYDSLGNKLSTTTAAGTSVAATTSSTYDELGSKLTSIDALGNVTRFVPASSGAVATFDSLGFLTSTLSSISQDNLSQSASIDSRGFISVDKSNSAGVVSTTNQLNNTVNNSYSAGGSLAARVDAGFSPYKFIYDALGRPANYLDPFGGSTTFAYDSLGNLALRTDARGMSQSYTYDEAGHLMSRTDTALSGTSAAFTYYTAGQVESATTGTGASYVTYYYDPSGKLTQAVYSDFPATQAQYGYSSTGSLASVLDPSGDYTSYSYDPAGRLSTLSSSQFSSLNPTLTVNYDANGNVTKEIGPDGTTTSFIYDQANHLISQATYASSGAQQSGQAYTYDQSGNRTTAADLRFQDNFSSGSLVSWSSVSGDTSWSEVGGTVTTTSSSDTILTQTAQPYPNTDYAFQANIKMTQNRDVGLVFRYQDDKNYYMVRASGFSGDSGSTTLWKYVNGSPSLLKSFTMAAVPAMNTWYTLRVQVQGAAIFWTYQTYGYQSPVFSATDTTYAGGNVGLKVGSGGGTNQDYFTDAILSAIPTIYTYDAASELAQVTTPDGQSTSFTYDKNGNRTASSSQTLWSDNFSATNPAWSSIGSGTWSLDSQGLPAQALKGSNSVSLQNALYIRSAQQNSNYTFQTSIKMDQNIDVGLVLRYQDANDFYLVRCSGQDGQAVALLKEQGGNWYTVKSWGTSLMPSLGSWYTVKASANGSTISFSYQAAGSWSPTYSWTDTTFAKGDVGLRIGWGGGTNTDHFTGVSLGTAQSYTYDAANELIQIKDSAGNTAANLTYDANGNTVSNNLNYNLYDERNRLTEASNADGTPGSVSYAYDSLGSLYSRSTRPASAAFAYVDDFSGAGDISSWTQPTGNTCWTTAKDNGQSVLSAGNNLSGASDIWRGGSITGDFNFQVKMKITATGSNSGGAGIVFRSANTASSIDQSEYYLCIRPSQKDANSSPAPEWDLQKVVGGVWSPLGSGPLSAGFAGLSQTTYHTLGVVASGSTCTVYIDGVPVARVTDTDASLTGSVGLAAYMANADFADARLEGPLSGSTTYYRYNEVTGALQAELNSSGAVTASYVTSPSGSPISVTRSGQTFFYHTNAHGDVTSITDASGTPVANFTYDAWGVPTELTASGQSVPIGTWAGTPGQGLFFLFGGMLYDAATGLYLTKSRVYDPKTGRFLSRDILDESGKNGVYKGFPFGKDAIGTNLYAWCGNNPINRIDPSGNHFVKESTWQQSGYLQSYMVYSGHWASQKDYYKVFNSVLKAGVNLLLYFLLFLIGCIDFSTLINDCYTTIVNTYYYVKSYWVDTSHKATRWIDTSHMVTHEVWVPDDEMEPEQSAYMDSSRNATPSGGNNSGGCSWGQVATGGVMMGTGALTAFGGGAVIAGTFGKTVVGAGEAVETGNPVLLIEGFEGFAYGGLMVANGSGMFVGGAILIGENVGGGIKDLGRSAWDNTLGRL